MYTPPIADPTGNTLAAWNDHDTYSKTLPEYRDLFRSCPAIVDAMDYSNLHADVRSAIWDAFDAADTAGYVADLSDPADMPADPYETTGDPVAFITLTRDEAIESYAAKVAHAFITDINGTYQWGLGTSYTQAELAGLLDPDELYYTWDISGDSTLLRSVVDHSPYRALEIATVDLGGGFAGSHKEAIGALIDAWRNDTWRHSFAGDPIHACTMDLVPPEGISRHGCYFATRYLSGLLRCVNIPAFIHENYYNGSGHSTASFPSIDGVLGHGDNLYNSNLVNLSGLGILDSLTYWNANIFPFGEGAGDDTKTPTRTLFALMAKANGGHTFDAGRFCSHGWDSLKSDLGYDLYLTIGEQTEHFNQLVAMSGCDGAAP